jgi:hypothetical protein
MRSYDASLISGICMRGPSKLVLALKICSTTSLSDTACAMIGKSGFAAEGVEVGV